MVDLEKLALQRDRGYLVRLLLFLALGLVASAFLWHGLTGSEVSGCIASSMLGGEAAQR